MTRRAWRRILIVVLAIAAVVAARLTWFAPEPVSVRVHPVGRGAVAETVTNSKAGTVRSRRRARLAPQASGRVVALPHREGASVEAGEVLLRLDDAVQRAEVALAERAVDVAQALNEKACIEAGRAERELERQRDLAAKGVISEDLLDGYESAHRLALSACDAAAAKVREAEAAVAAAEAALALMRIHAPFAGVLAEVAPEVGEWVTPSPPLMPVPAAIDLIDPTSLYVSAPMDEVDSGRLAAGQAAIVTLDSFPGESFEGRVVRVAPYVLDVEAQNRTVEIEVELGGDALDGRLLAGTSADVEVVLDERGDVLWIPTAALVRGDRVFVVEDGRIAERAVETGLANWDRTEIVQGLSGGERVVTSLEREEVAPGAEVVVAPGDAP